MRFAWCERAARDVHVYFAGTVVRAERATRRDHVAAGHVRHIGYDAAKQGGTDFGLPTDIWEDPELQADGTTRQPSQAIYYDASGNVVCAKADANDPHTATILTYDALNRVTAVGDPDDASLTSAVCSKTSGLPGSTIVTRTSYFSDGSVATKQTPAQAAAGVSTQYTYDLDSNVKTEVHHFTTADGTITKWYDGADRLVEVQQPTIANDFLPLSVADAGKISMTSVPAETSRSPDSRTARMADSIRRRRACRRRRLHPPIRLPVHRAKIALDGRTPRGLPSMRSAARPSSIATPVAVSSPSRIAMMRRLRH